MRWFHKIDRVSGWVFTAGLIISAIALVLLTLLIAFDAIGRKIGFAIGVSNEVAGYLMVCLVFFSLAYVMRAGRHIEITLVTDKLPYKMRRSLRMVTSLMGLAFMIWLIYYTMRPVLRSYALKSVSMTSLRVTLWPLEMIIPLGFSMLALAIVLEIAKTVLPSHENNGNR